jgi:hypothetical protein
MSGIPLDELNVARQRLLRKRVATMQRERWVRAEETSRG